MHEIKAIKPIICYTYPLDFAHKERIVQTFEDLTRRGVLWHKLPLGEQIVVLQNTVVSLTNGNGISPLHISKIKNSELVDLYALVTTPEFMGPFAATKYEGIYAWKRYIQGSEAIKALFSRAAFGGYWAKYVGLAKHDFNVMGELMHALSLVLESYLPVTLDEGYHFSPLHCLPSYAQMFAAMPTPKDVLVIGAISPVSVVDIWLLGQLYYPEAHITIIDLNGETTNQAAIHYGINFEIRDGLDSRLPDRSFDLILTHHLIPSASEETGDEKAVSQKLFEEMFRLLRTCGHVALVEPPFFDDSIEISDELQVHMERARLIAQLSAVGFADASVDEAMRFSTRRKALDSYFRKGIYTKAQLLLPEVPTFSITATKK